MQIAAVGGQCEKLHMDSKEETAKSEFAKARDGYLVEVEDVRDMPPEDRQEWLNSPDYIDHQMAVRILLQTEQGMLGPEYLSMWQSYDEEDREQAKAASKKAPDPYRTTSIPLKRPKGKRESIISQVSKETGLTDSEVRECWRKYRKLLERLDGDEE